MCFFVFFKQKTAYEMRISDWSSDVCSSDLEPEAPTMATLSPAAMAKPMSSRMVSSPEGSGTRLPRPVTSRAGLAGWSGAVSGLGVRVGGGRAAASRAMRIVRSEEHTSELQSLMRISYAVIGLKKKKKIITLVIAQ